LRVLRRETVAVLIVLWDFLCCWHNARAILFVVQVVGEQVILFAVDDCFNNFSCVIAFIRKNLNNNIHDCGSKGWEAHENPVDNAAAELLQLRVDVVQEFKSWLSQFFQLGLD
jgi:hypothetical protein